MNLVTLKNNQYALSSPTPDQEFYEALGELLEEGHFCSRVLN
jgi:hypothetical protein